MSHYTHLTIEEREKARAFLEQRLSFRAIARKLNRSPSTVSREFKRNSYANGTYTAYHAEKLYRKRKKNCGAESKLNNEVIKAHIVERLEMRWTPEQIAGRAKIEKSPFFISNNTISRAVDNGLLPKQLKKIMRFKWKYRKHKTSDNRGEIPDTVSIHERPAGAENRSRFGHWESDTVLGKRKTGCFGTHVERKSSFLIAFHISDRLDNAFTKATVKAFKSVPDKLKKSFTVDNGKEFAAHKQLEQLTGMKVFFCDPYSPWQRGTNENTNGLLRQFFPKGTSFSNISNNKLQNVVDLINNRPRKRFNFMTPNEILLKCCT